MTQETALVKAEPEAQSGKLALAATFRPTNLTEAIALAKMMARSDMVPKEFRQKPDNILVAMQMGAEVGLAPMQALQNICVINGRPSVWGDAALGLVVVHKDYEWHKEGWEGKDDSLTAVFQIKRRGQEVYTSKFTVAQAKKAGLWNKEGPWRNYPERMLQVRARGFGIRDRFPDALRGLGIVEESMDVPPETPDVRRQREQGMMEVGLESLRASSEPNRGHGNEGLNQERKTAKQEDVICADCRKVNGHEDNCPVVAKQQQDAKTSKPTVKGAYMIVKADKSNKKGSGEPYLILEVVDNNNNHGKLYCWHQSMHEALLVAAGKGLLCEVSEQKKGNSTYYSVEHIIDLGGVPYVEGQPAEQGTVEEEEWDAGS